MENYKIEAKIYTENSYPKAIWMTFKVETENRETAINKGFEFVDKNIIKPIDIEITATIIK